MNSRRRRLWGMAFWGIVLGLVFCALSAGIWFTYPEAREPRLHPEAESMFVLFVYFVWLGLMFMGVGIGGLLELKKQKNARTRRRT